MLRKVAPLSLWVRHILALTLCCIGMASCRYFIDRSSFSIWSLCRQSIVRDVPHFGIASFGRSMPTGDSCAVATSASRNSQGAPRPRLVVPKSPSQPESKGSKRTMYKLGMTTPAMVITGNEYLLPAMRRRFLPPCFRAREKRRVFTLCSAERVFTLSVVQLL